MNDKSFIDTNMFVYAADSESGVKSRTAQQLIARAIQNSTGVISYQVIQEFLNVALRKFATPLSLEQAEWHIAKAFRPLFIVPSSLGLYSEALGIFSRHKVAWYDSLILAAAAEAGCSVLYTEDMQHGTTIRGVRIVNPFLTN